MGEVEVGEAAGDQCQSMMGLGKGRAGHGLGTGTGGNWARTKHGLGTNWARTGHGHGRVGHRWIVSERHGYPLVELYVQKDGRKKLILQIEELFPHTIFKGIEP